MALIDEALDDLAEATRKVEEANAKISRLIDDAKVNHDHDDVSNTKSGSLESACRNYYYLTEKYAELDDKRKKVFSQLEYVSREVIPDIMTERGVRNITLDDVERQFVKTIRTSASMVDKEEALGWLRDIGAGDLIQPTVNSSSFSAFVKQYVEEKQIDPPDCVKMTNMTVTQVRKSTKKG